jgi:hypothetical protein
MRVFTMGTFDLALTRPQSATVGVPACAAYPSDDFAADPMGFRIFGRELVTAEAVGLLSIGVSPTAIVLPVGNDFEMVRSNAWRIPAEMIEVHAFLRKTPVGKEPRPAMSEPRCRMASVEPPVAKLHAISGPKPALTGLVDLGPEQRVFHASIVRAGYLQ